MTNLAKKMFDLERKLCWNSQVVSEQVTLSIIIKQWSKNKKLLQEIAPEYFSRTKGRCFMIWIKQYAC